MQTTCGSHDGVGPDIQVKLMELNAQFRPGYC
jgi:hypothetical protein